MTNLYAYGKVAARISDDGILSKKVNSRKHFLKIPPAIAFDKALFDEAETMGAQEIEIFDRDTDRLFTCSVAFFREHCFEFDRGYGAQLALVLKHWTVIEDNQPRLMK